MKRLVFLFTLILSFPSWAQNDTARLAEPCDVWSEFMFLKEFHFDAATKEGTLLFRDVYKTSYAYQLSFKKKHRFHLTLTELNRYRVSEFEVDTMGVVFYLQEPDSLPYQSPPCKRPTFGIRTDIALPMLAGLVTYGIIRSRRYHKYDWTNPCSILTDEGSKYRDYNYLLFSNDSTCEFSVAQRLARQSSLALSHGETSHFFHFNNGTGFAAGFRTFIIDPSQVPLYKFYCADGKKP